MTQTQHQIVDRVDEGPISYLTINRPKQGNSLSLATIEALHGHLVDLRAQTGISVIVLTGTGGRIFSAGHDLAEVLEEAAPEFSHELAEKCSEMMLAFRSQPQIIIARVEGVATAAGCQLVAAADLAIAESGARFATPGVNIGLWCLTPQVALSRNVAPKHAMQMLTTGRLYDAEYALRIGLVNEVVAPDSLDEAVSQLAAEIASKSSYTLALGKASFYRQLQMPIADAYSYASEVMVRNMEHPDASEGIAAFLQKREPNWTGR